MFVANLGATRTEFGASVEEREAYVAGLMKDVRRALDVLKYVERWWIPAGKMWYAISSDSLLQLLIICRDALNEITSMGPGNGTDINVAEDPSQQPDLGARLSAIWGTLPNSEGSPRPVLQGPLILDPFGPAPSAAPAVAAQVATIGLGAPAMLNAIPAADPDLDWQLLGDWSTFGPLATDASINGIRLPGFDGNELFGDPLRWLGLNAYNHSMFGSEEQTTTPLGEQSSVETDWWPV